MTEEQQWALVLLDAEESIIGEDEDYNVLAYSHSRGCTVLIDEMGAVWSATWKPMEDSWNV